MEWEREEKRSVSSHCPYAPATLVLWAAAHAASVQITRLRQVPILYINSNPNKFQQSTLYTILNYPSWHPRRLGCLLYITFDSFNMNESPELSTAWPRRNRVCASEGNLIGSSWTYSRIRVVVRVMVGDQRLPPSGNRDKLFWADGVLKRPYR